jgi:DinB family protein
MGTPKDRLIFEGGIDSMKETAQEYIRRINSHVEGKQPLQVQAATANKIERLMKGATPSKLRKRPVPDKWSVNEILAHMAETEIVGGFRMRMILGAPGTPIPAFDQDAWVVSGHYEKRDPRKSLEQFRVLREANLALLKSLKPDQWKHYGIHSERGQETIEQVTKMFAGHDLNHIAQIEDILMKKK